MDFSGPISATSGLKSQIARAVSMTADRVLDLSMTIHDDPELSSEEHRAAAAIEDLLERVARLEAKVG